MEEMEEKEKLIETQETIIEKEIIPETQESLKDDEATIIDTIPVETLETQETLEPQKSAYDEIQDEIQKEIQKEIEIEKNFYEADTLIDSIKSQPKRVSTQSDSDDEEEIVHKRKRLKKRDVEKE